MQSFFSRLEGKSKDMKCERLYCSSVRQQFFRVLSRIFFQRLWQNRLSIIGKESVSIPRTKDGLEVKEDVGLVILRFLFSFLFFRALKPPALWTVGDCRVLYPLPPRFLPSSFEAKRVQHARNSPMVVLLTFGKEGGLPSGVRRTVSWGKRIMLSGRGRWRCAQRTSVVPRCLLEAWEYVGSTIGAYIASKPAYVGAYRIWCSM